MNNTQDVVRSNPPLLETRGVSKSYPGLIAVDSVDFNLLAGEIHGLVGANGAGNQFDPDTEKTGFRRLLDSWA